MSSFKHLHCAASPLGRGRVCTWSHWSCSVFASNLVFLGLHTCDVTNTAWRSGIWRKSTPHHPWLQDAGIWSRWNLSLVCCAKFGCCVI